MQKQRTVLDMTGGGSKVWCDKEQYCIGTWNVRSTNQGKLKIVKQEMARVDIDILGISELKWTGMGEFNSNDNYIYYRGPESLRTNGVAIIVSKRIWNGVLGCNLKNDRVTKGQEHKGHNRWDGQVCVADDRLWASVCPSASVCPAWDAEPAGLWAPWRQLCHNILYCGYGCGQWGQMMLCLSTQLQPLPALMSCVTVSWSPWPKLRPISLGLLWKLETLRS